MIVFKLLSLFSRKGQNWTEAKWGYIMCHLQWQHWKHDIEKVFSASELSHAVSSGIIKHNVFFKADDFL